ncbi:MAG: hypothetical protein ACLUE2_11445 [Bacteroides cellulosilyticus]
MAAPTEVTEDGSVTLLLRGNRNYWTLLHLRYDRHALAGHGESGSKNRFW